MVNSKENIERGDHAAIETHYTRRNLIFNRQLQISKKNDAQTCLARALFKQESEILELMTQIRNFKRLKFIAGTNHAGTRRGTNDSLIWDAELTGC